MSNIDKIRQEIDTRRQHMVEELMGHEENCEYHRIKGMHDAYVDLLTFLDYSLPEEKPSDDLEEAAEEYADKHGFRVPYDGSNNYYDDVDVKASKEGFKAGAEWQKEQMMKDAVEAKIYGYDDGSFELIASWLDMPNNSIYKDGDKVKIIIVKQDDRPRD